MMFSVVLIGALVWKPVYHFIMMLREKDEQKDKEHLAVIKKHFEDLVNLVKP